MVLHELPISKTKHRILFVSQTARVEAPYLDPSVRYRCYNPAEVMREHGVIADVVAQQKFRDEFIDLYDGFVFHRPYGGDAGLFAWMAQIERAGKIAFADYDDLIFAPDYALQSSIYLNKVRTEVQTKGIFLNSFRGLKIFKNFTVSTEPLKRHILALMPDANVHVIPNGLSENFVRSFDEKKVDPGQKLRQEHYIISYLSGTASHNRDFASITDMLGSILSTHKQYRLAIAGPLELLQDDLPRNSYFRLPYREYRDFFSNISSAFINIAPLSADNAFNECKSGLKFFESGIWGVPTIATPIADFQRFKTSDGLLLPEDIEGWRKLLIDLLDHDFYCKCVNGLQEYCKVHCMATQPGLRLLELLVAAK